VQEAVEVLVDLHAGAQKVLVVGPPRGGDERGIGDVGQHQDDAHLAGGRGDERLEQGGVGHEVGRGEDDLLARRVDGGEDGLVDRLRRRARARGEQLHGRGRGFLVGDRLGQKRLARGDVLIAVELPVAEEGDGEFLSGRTDDSHGGVDPPTGLLPARGPVADIDDVLTAAVGDAAVEDGDLAVVAEVEPSEDHAPEVGRERLHDLDARGPHPSAELVPKEIAAPSAVHEEAYGDAPSDGVGKGGCDDGSGAIGIVDVVAEVDVLLCDFDVRLEGLEHRDVVAKERQGIAAERGKAGDGGPEAGDGLEFIGNVLRREAPLRKGVVGALFESLREHLVLPGPACAEAHLPDQEVEEQAGDGKDEDDREPSEGGGDRPATEDHVHGE
jgi:hypothetical protein